MPSPSLLLAAISLALTIPGVPAADAADDPPADASITIDAPSAAWTERIEWGIDRFRAAGLQLPSTVVAVHTDGAPCDGNSGLFVHGDPAEVHICTPRPADTRAARLITLHELAHAWAETQLGADDRAELLALRGLSAWVDPDLPPHEWGAEHVAEVVSWGLMDEEIRIIRIYDAEPPALVAAFDLLVHRPPLWGAAA